MVRHHHQCRIFRQLPQGFADQLVDIDITIDNRVRVWGIGDRVMSWVLGVHRPPHHVRDLIEVAKVVEQKATLELLQNIVELVADLSVDHRHLRHEIGVVEHSLIESVSVFGHALGVKTSRCLCKFGGIANRSANRHQRRNWIKVDRGHIEFELRPNFL